MPPLLVIPALPQTLGAKPELPELPALCELLRLSDHPTTAANWRSGLLGDLGAPLPAQIPESVMAAVGSGIPAGRHICLAAPVHAIAGMHRVHLHAAGILPLQKDERAGLEAGFAAQFGDELRLHPAGDQWLLEGSIANEADESDPADWLGAPLERQVARSPEQRRLRRLGAEMEMWLADLPLNAERQRQGRLTVNLLWLWGGGRACDRPAMPALAAAQIYGAANDAWLAGCAALTGKGLAGLPPQWVPDAADKVMVLPMANSAAQLLGWETAWFAPALADLRAGRIVQLNLRIGRSLHRVRYWRWRRLLRRKSPWWQRSGA